MFDHRKGGFPWLVPLAQNPEETQGVLLVATAAAVFLGLDCFGRTARFAAACLAARAVGTAHGADAICANADLAATAVHLRAAAVSRSQGRKGRGDGHCHHDENRV
ncbi:MAG: hypothetical protein MUC92_13210 [Fimbriimonadaceae bacterium]|nr:hypothetical protein [Fimbriimonadaceae bacterium]